MGSYTFSKEQWRIPLFDAQLIPNKPQDTYRRHQVPPALSNNVFAIRPARYDVHEANDHFHTSNGQKQNTIYSVRVIS